MALKDHILKLADGVSKCQENAKSLAQVIFRGLDDIADNLPDSPGGGSTVDVTQVLSSGTKIATITVDDDPTDLYAPDPTAPTDVDVTQVVSTGTKIATITVDDVPTDIYAPSASGHTYSTTEQVVGKWVDGITDVYEKSVITEIPNNTQSSYNHNIANISQIISIEGGAWGSNQFLPANMSGYVLNSNEGALRVTATTTAVVVQPIGWDGSSYTGYWTLRYLKS